jgi:hypothetical protein
MPIITSTTGIPRPRPTLSPIFLVLLPLPNAALVEPEVTTGEKDLLSLLVAAETDCPWPREQQVELEKVPEKNSSQDRQLHEPSPHLFRAGFLVPMMRKGISYYYSFAMNETG